MKKKYLIFLFLLALGFYSCNSDELISENTDQDKTYITAEEKNKLLADMIDTTVVYIETEANLNEIKNKVAYAEEQKLIRAGYIKIDPDDVLFKTKASVQKYEAFLNPNAARKIDYSNFIGKFSKAFCDANNEWSMYKLSPSKKYLCGWCSSGTSFNLAPNQRGGVLPSPEAAYRPSTKSEYSERGYDAFVNKYNNYIIESHQLIIICEDVNHTTILMESRFPDWDTSRGYVINYAILTM